MPGGHSTGEGCASATRTSRARGAPGYASGWQLCSSSAFANVFSGILAPLPRRHYLERARVYAGSEGTRVRGGVADAAPRCAHGALASVSQPLRATFDFALLVLRAVLGLCRAARLYLELAQRRHEDSKGDQVRGGVADAAPHDEHGALTVVSHLLQDAFDLLMQ